MIRVVAKSYPKKENIDDVIKVYKELVEATKQENGCIQYQLFQDESDPAILTMIEAWDSKDSLDKHLQSEHFVRIIPLVGKLCSRDTEINLYHRLF